MTSRATPVRHVLSLVAALFLASTQVASQGISGGWHVDDDSIANVPIGPTARNYRLAITSNGDTEVKVIVTDQHGYVVFSDLLTGSNTMDVGVPAGGELHIEDPHDSNSAGVSGSVTPQ